ncbi:MAG: Clp protease N-terminal domain-containing protein [Candidatus Sulfotelmatobacter sp.]
MPASVAVERVLNTAQNLAHDFRSDKVEPLYLLAAALHENSSESVRVFSEYGITEDNVLAGLRQQNDQGPEK